MCVCGIFFPTHHEMWLGYYPSEFLSFVLLWVARDLFQYLRKHREKSLIYASVALLYAQIPPSNATWPLQRMQRRPTTLTVPLQHHLLMRDQLWTPLSKSRIWSSFCSSSCPVEATWLDVSSSYVAPDWWMWHCRGEASASRSFNVLLHIKQQCLVHERAWGPGIHYRYTVIITFTCYPQELALTGMSKPHALIHQQLSHKYSQMR